MLEVKNIRYLWSKEIPTRGIKKITFSLQEGEILGILGKSGSGKSTLALCISGLLDIQEGEVTLDGNKVSGPSQQLIPGHPGIALLRQDIQILENHTVLENLRDVLTGYDEWYKERQCKKILQVTGLSAFAGQKAKSMSQGQKQRLSLARSLIHIPRLLILDEPFNHLDFQWKFRLTKWVLSEQRKHRFMILWITHDYSEILKYCSGVLCLHHGRIIGRGIPMKIFFRPSSKIIAEMFGPYVIRKENNKNIFIRPNVLMFSEKKVPGSIRVKREGSYFNGFCYENILSDGKGGQWMTYSEKEIPFGKKGFLTVKK